MRTDLFDYDLPKSYIAQQPAEPRDSSRLLVLERARGRVEHRRFSEIGAFLRAGDLLVANDSRVIAARLRGHKSTGGAVEVFLLHKADDEGREWSCLVRGRGLRAGAEVELDARPIRAQIASEHGAGLRTVRFSEPIGEELAALGEIPLPPYIRDYRGDRGRYQTVYSRVEGSAAAPTAGLHFTPELLQALAGDGVGWETVTLHVGLDTFGPVTAERVAEHRIHREWAELPAQAAQGGQCCQGEGRGGSSRSVRPRRGALEFAATSAQGIDPYGPSVGREAVAPFAAEVDLFIYPGYRFRAVDALLTNFHLPRSSLLMLVSAFVGQAYAGDVDKGTGDAPGNVRGGEGGGLSLLQFRRCDADPMRSVCRCFVRRWAVRPRPGQGAWMGLSRRGVRGGRGLAVRRLWSRSAPPSTVAVRRRSSRMAFSPRW